MKIQENSKILSFCVKDLFREDGLKPFFYHFQEQDENSAFREVPGPMVTNEILAQQIANRVDLIFVPEKEEDGNLCMVNSSEVTLTFRQTCSSLDLLNYTYAVLFSSEFRNTFRKLQDIASVRIPYPRDAIYFWKLAILGEQLRDLNPLKNVEEEGNFAIFFGKNVNHIPKITKVVFKLDEDKNKTGRIFINEEQYFNNVPQSVWNFTIGGDSPAQKWLRDRQGGELGSDDILYFQESVRSLYRSSRLAENVDKFIFYSNGDD